MGWAGWSIEPPLAYVALAGMLYWLGGRRRSDRATDPLRAALGGRRRSDRATDPLRAALGDRTRTDRTTDPLRVALGGRRRSDRGTDPLRAAAFWGGLATIVIALDSPIDGYADKLFWVHMVQHVLLLTVAPPLVLLGRPWPRMWRALPLSTRTRVGRTIARSSIAAPLRAVARPRPAWVLFNATIIAWHIPAAYNATLSSSSIHQLEHAMFFFTGLLFWARMIDPGPLRPRLDWPARIAYLVGAMVIGWSLAVTLVVVPHPLYAHYAALAQRPGGISATTDQQLAAGVMWVPGSISYTIAILIGFYRWLEPEPAARPRVSAFPT